MLMLPNTSLSLLQAQWLPFSFRALSPVMSKALIRPCLKRLKPLPMIISSSFPLSLLPMLNPQILRCCMMNRRPLCMSMRMKLRLRLVLQPKQVLEITFLSFGEFLTLQLHLRTPRKLVYAPIPTIFHMFDGYALHKEPEMSRKSAKLQVVSTKVFCLKSCACRV